MNREEKRAEVEKLQEAFREAPAAFLVDFCGLKVVQITALRRRVRAAAGSYRVVKNRLAIRAVRSTDLEALSDLLRGPTAVITGGGDPVTLSRVLRDFSREHPALNLKGGWVEGQRVPPEGIARLAGLPARPELIARFAGVLGAPVSRFCFVLQAPLRGFVTVLREIAGKGPRSPAGAD